MSHLISSAQWWSMHIRLGLFCFFIGCIMEPQWLIIGRCKWTNEISKISNRKLLTHNSFFISCSTKKSRNQVEYLKSLWLTLRKKAESQEPVHHRSKYCSFTEVMTNISSLPLKTPVSDIFAKITFLVFFNIIFKRA